MLTANGIDKAGGYCISSSALVLKDTLYERFGLYSQNPYDHTRHWRIKVITSKQQLTTLKSAHEVFIG
jgi:hypothetical protein